MKTLEETKSPDITEELRSLYTNIKGAKKRSKKKLKKQEEELKNANKWIWYRQIGDSLLASPNDYPKGSGSVSVINTHTEEIEDITLNVKLNVYQNAELFYKKAAKGERGESVIKQNINDTKKELILLENVLNDIRDFMALEENLVDGKITKFIEEINDKIANSTIKVSSVGSKKNKSTEVKLPYRKYVIDGFELYIGKNTTQNDELSTKFAKPWDVWMHVAGHKGSHCVLRRKKNTDWPPKTVIEKSASLAVWFSKARHTSYAEVHVTEARFVRKRRKAPPGEVIAERCKTVRVAPQDPRTMTF